MSLQDLRNNTAGSQVCSRCVHWLKRSLQTWACAPMAGGFLCSWAKETAGSWGKGPFPTPDLLSVPLWMSPASTDKDTQGSWSKAGKREGMWGAFLLNCPIVFPYSALWNCALRTQTMRQPQHCMEATPAHSSLQVHLLLFPPDCSLQGSIINSPTSAICFYRQVSVPGWITLDVCTLSISCKERWALQWQQAQCTVGLSL